MCRWLRFLGVVWLLSTVAWAEEKPPAPALPADVHGDPLPAGVLARMGSVRLRGATVAAVWPNGNIISIGGKVFIWDLATGKELRRVDESIVAVSPDGKLAAGFKSKDSAERERQLSSDHVLQVWDVAGGKAIRRWVISGDGRDGIEGPLAVAADGTVAACTGSDPPIRLWNVKADKPVAEVVLGGRPHVEAMVFSPDSKLLACLADRELRLWPVGEKEPRPLADARKWFRSLAFSPDGKLLAAGAEYWDGRKPDQVDLMVWETATGKAVHHLKGHRRGVTAVAFSPDGRQLASGGGDIRFWDLATGKLLRASDGLRSSIQSLAFAPDGKTLVSGGPTIRLWDPATGQEVRPLGGHLDDVNALAISPDGRLVTSTSDDNTIRFWDRATGQELRRGIGTTGVSDSVEFTPDGKTAITAGNDHIIRVWDARTGAELRQLLGHKGPVLSVSVSPGGTMLASAGGWIDENLADYAIRLWDLKTGKELRRFGDHRGSVHCVCWSPTGKMIASSSSDGAVRLWDARTGKELRRFDNERKHRSSWLAFSPDGSLLASPVGEGIVVWDTANGREHWRPAIKSLGTIAAFSPDGSVLAVGDDDGQVHLLETLSHLEIATFPHQAYLKTLQFSRDGRFLISGGGEGNLLVWDATRQAKPQNATTVELTAADRARLWQDLGGPDVGKADRAGWTLTLGGQPVVPWLQERLQPVPLLKAEQVKQWLTDLGSEERATRDKAGQKLEALGQAAEPSLRAALAELRSLDVSAQIKDLLSRLQGPPVHPGTLQNLRAVTVLERIDRPEATAVVEKLAQGQPGARITEAARAVLERRRLRQVVDVPPAPESDTEKAETQLAPISRGPERRDAQGDLLPPGALMRLGTAHWHPADSVVCLHYSPNGKVLVSAGRHVCIWDPDTGRVLHRFGYVPSAMAAITISGNSELLAHADEDGTIHLRELLTAREIRSFKGSRHRGHALSFSPDGKVLAVSGNDGIVQLWDVATGKEIRRLAGQENSNSMVAFSPAGNLLATAGRDGIVRLWDPADGKEVRQIGGYQGPPVFSPDGKLLALRGAKKVIHVIEAATGQVVRQIEADGHSIDFHSNLTFSPDGKLLASGSGIFPQVLRVWEVASGQEKLCIRGHNGKDVTAVAFSPDGNVLATAGHDYVIRRWDLATGKELAGADDRQGAVNDVVFSRDGKTVITAGENGMVRGWDAATGKELSHFQATSGERNALVLSPDGALAASSKRGKALSAVISLWNVPTGKEVRDIEVPNRISVRLALSSDRKKLVTLGVRGEIDVWDLADARSLGSINGRAMGMNFFTPLLLSPDGEVLATTSGRDPQEEVRLWHLPSGTQLQHMLGGHFFGPMAFSPDGNCLAAPAEQVHYYEVPTGKERCQFRGHWCVAISPDGRLLACGQNDVGSLSLYALTTGKEIARFAGHRGRLSRLAFSPDSARLASASWDSTVLIWDIAAVAERARPALATLTDARLEELWQDLADADASRAYRARTQLLVAPQQTVRYLNSRLAPVARADEQVAQLIRDLDGDDFGVRERAAEKLAELGDLVKPALRKLLEGKPSLEARRRIVPLLVKRETLTSPEQVRSWRALELLEHIGTPEARALLVKMANGAPEALLTRTAKAGVARLK
jgi:WD40 repeat protein